MKIREGFVSNSSSSSFTCQISGMTASGCDLMLHEAGMVSCVNGHIFCKEYIVGYGNMTPDDVKRIIDNEEPNIKKYFEEKIVDYTEENLLRMLDYNGMTLPPLMCPLCTLGAITHEDMLKYILKRNGETKREVLEEIKDKFETIENFKKYCYE